MLDSQDKIELAEVERRLNDTFVYDDYGKNNRGYDKCSNGRGYNKCSMCPFPICRTHTNYKCWYDI